MPTPIYFIQRTETTQHKHNKKPSKHCDKINNKSNDIILPTSTGHLATYLFTKPAKDSYPEIQ